eukprot:1646960-Amphidinium_carterae.1
MPRFLQQWSGQEVCDIMFVLLVEVKQTQIAGKWPCSHDSMVKHVDAEVCRNLHYLNSQVGVT